MIFFYILVMFIENQNLIWLKFCDTTEDQRVTTVILSECSHIVQ